MKIIKYEGNSKYIIILYSENDKLYVFYALTNKLMVDNEIDRTYEYEDLSSYSGWPIVNSHKITVKIPLLNRPNNNKIFTILNIQDESEYELIKTVLEDLL